MLRISKFFYLVLIVGLVHNFLNANNSNNDNRPIHEIHSMMIYNFLKYTKWPESAEKVANFKISVIGDEELYETLVKWYGPKKRGSQNYSISFHKSVSEFDNDAHIVYLAKNKSREFSELKEMIAGKPILTVTNGSGLAKKGSNINFKLVSGSLKFEMNLDSVKKSNLQIASSLQSLAILI